MRRSILPLLWLTLGLLLVAAAILATAAPAHGQGPGGQPGQPSPTPPPTPAISIDELLAQAQRTSEDASKAVDAVSTMLNFLEVVGVLLGVLAGAATLAGFRTIFEYRAELNNAKAELNALRAELKADADKARETLQAVEQRITESLAQSRAQGDRAIRALTLLQLGTQQMEARNWKAALQTIESAYALDPDNRATNYFLGELYIHQRELDKGIGHLERAQADGSVYPPAEAALAYAVRLLGDRATDPNERNQLYAESEGHFLRALRADPQVRDINGESVYGALGGLYRRQGRLDDAIRCYREAERITPQNSYPINNLAMLYALKGDEQQAKHYFARSLSISAKSLDANPSDYWARFDLISAQTALGQADAAIQQIDELVAHPPGIGPLEGLAETLKTLDKIGAAQDIERVLGHLQAAIDRLKTRQSAG